MSEYGQEINYETWANAYSDPNMSETDCLARVIYAEDTLSKEGQRAVAKEIWNRKMSGNPKRYAKDKVTLNWKNIIFCPSQYSVTGNCSNAIKPTHNEYWDNALARAKELVAGAVPVSNLGSQKNHRSASSFNANSINGIDTTTIIQIGGNSFFDYLPGY